MEPTGSGVGGDLFAFVWDPKSKKLYGYNGSGRSLKALSRQWFAAHGYSAIPPHGPLPVTVPGVVDGWFALHGRFGKLSIKGDLAPAIGYSREDRQSVVYGKIGAVRVVLCGRSKIKKKNTIPHTLTTN